jgi:hypothetical protein
MTIFRFFASYMVAHDIKLVEKEIGKKKQKGR